MEKFLVFYNSFNCESNQLIILSTMLCLIIRFVQTHTTLGAQNQIYIHIYIYMCVCVCVREREREREFY